MVSVPKGNENGVWAKGEPPALGAGHRVSSILTTPTGLFDLLQFGCLIFGLSSGLDLTFAMSAGGFNSLTVHFYVRQLV
jgi:hypothetical protein